MSVAQAVLAGSGERTRVPVSLTALAIIGSLSLWDFYIGEVRVFDFLGLALAISAAALRIAYRRDFSLTLERPALFGCLALTAVVIAYSIAGVLVHPDNLKPAVGLLFGLVVFVVISTLRFDSQGLQRALRIIIIVHLAAFFGQLAFYYLTRRVLNYHVAFGLEPRLISSIFRPAGLFLEPAIYCFFAASMLLVRWQARQRLERLDYLLLLSMVASLSIWGIVIATALMAVFKPRAALYVAGALVLVTLVVISVADFSHSPVYMFFANRLHNLGSDASTQGRFGGTLGLLSAVLVDPIIIFGGGVNNFFEEHGANGLSFIVNSLGLIGTAALLCACLAMAPPRRWFLFLFGIALLLTAAPLWKDMYFWSWMGLMVHPAVTHSWERSPGMPG